MKKLQITESQQIFKQSFARLFLNYILAILLFINNESVGSGTENLYIIIGNNNLFSSTDASPFEVKGGLAEVSPDPNEFFSLNDLFSIFSGQSPTQLPDSMYGIKNNGHIKIPYRWYYYNISDELDTASSEYFNGNNEYNNSIGHRIYDNKGRLVTFIIQQPNYISRIEPRDSTISVIYIEQNMYEGDKLVKNTFKYLSYGTLKTEISNYEYDSVGRLVHKSVETDAPPSSLNEYEYLYNEDNQLIYMINLEDNGLYNLHKYIYNVKDTLKITTEYYGRFLDIDILDSISDWREINTYTEVFDSLNRKTCETINTYDIRFEENKYFKAEYSYYKSNQIKNIVFYLSNDTLNESYKAITKMAYNYTKDGDILCHENTFYDERTNTWEIAESETYYYPDLTTGVESKSIEKNSDNLVIYPNPSSDILYLQYFPPSLPKTSTSATEDDLRYNIYNIQGMKVKAGNMENNQIIISELNRGIYILAIENNEQVYYRRFIKK